MLLLLILIAWLSFSGLAVLLCTVASRADEVRDEQVRARWESTPGRSERRAGRRRLCAGCIPRPAPWQLMSAAEI